MAFDYDGLYADTRHALGAPTSVIVRFFERLELRNGRVLDVGCGQGRDALFIAALGHSVIGVDMSPNGIRDLIADAAKDKLPVEGVVADICDYRPEGLFDVVLIDRTLHMLPRTKRLAVLDTLLDHVGEEGWLLIADERSNMADFKELVAAHCWGWDTEYSRGGYLFARRASLPA